VRHPRLLEYRTTRCPELCGALAIHSQLKEPNMVRFHEGIGTLVVLAFLALTVVNVLQITGKQITWSRQLSFGAAGLLALQYVIGFSLLGGDHDITPFHYLFALLALVTVGLEHAKADKEENEATRARMGAAFAAATTVIVIIAYAIGQSA
jgi:hypothetical protein